MQKRKVITNHFFACPKKRHLLRQEFLLSKTGFETSPYAKCGPVPSEAFSAYSSKKHPLQETSFNSLQVNLKILHFLQPIRLQGLTLNLPDFKS